MSTSERGGNPADSNVILPATTPQPAVDLDTVVESRKRSEPTPTARLEARADRHIIELQKYQVNLKAELDLVRYKEVPHLRADLRWLEVRVSTLHNALTQLKTSYEWAISFNWFSFALIAIGGAVVSYAAFLPDPPPPPERANTVPPWFGSQKFIATLALMALLIGVVMQAILSRRGTKALLSLSELSTEDPRPSPNP